ncbi:MAG: phosphoribosylamine--glycine ligase [Nitrospinaceae bacterium]|nr:phosphoribosylamine--glycine ligase [Nitrospinaceae bacterium]NIR56054.1 phosphoribosylamine--glycine ligase [Nitrospinaceae bacterium]NIS86499.1 phosphoribosylamine--glycine ligase [Nitrospinaceae bacterium]NIT83334.1 phosphoribosylamine--glycine ligase [Nitrospinaceae bacterium]NIU45543.1 phosphoribosylamine--glycine ligase [Nitrospinaceae bacterium]
MKILVVGGGGREHALAWKIKQSPRVSELFCAPGNPGTAAVAANVDLQAEDVDGLLNFALEQSIDLTVVGPEQPLVLGLADRFQEKGLKVFGPSRAAAQLEGSKAFSKDLMLKYGVPTAQYAAFDNPEAAREYLKGKGPQVVKADGLAAGKGVFVCANEQEAADAIGQIMNDKIFGASGDRILIEEKLEGQEVSLLAFTDGSTVLAMEAAQDHKAAFDGDTGPNTGGMGAYSPAPVFTPELKQRVLNEVMVPAVNGMRQEGIPYQGVLYAGLMITADGPKVLEFNARFGDPETQPLMMRMASDIVPVMEACADGTLDRCALEWKPDTAVCVVMASQGYPGAYAKGKPIQGLEAADSLPGVTVFHAGTKQQGDAILTGGGRVLGVTALGGNIQTAIVKAYQAVGKIQWDGVHYRKDIGQKAL